MRADSKHKRHFNNNSDDDWFPTGGGKPRPEPAKPTIPWQKKQVPGWEAREFNALLEQRKREQPPRKRPRIG